MFVCLKSSNIEIHAGCSASDLLSVVIHYSIMYCINFDILRYISVLLLLLLLFLFLSVDAKDSSG